MRRFAVVTLVLLVLAWPSRAFAHGLGDSHDLPLPLWLFLFGASVVVVVSFFQMSLFIGERHASRQYPRIDLLGYGLLRTVLTGPTLLLVLRFLSVALFLLVVASGLFGQQETDTNFAPVFVWITWWIGLGFFTALVGNVWPLLNPWKILFEWAELLVRRLGAKKGLQLREPYPASWGVWPALALYGAFVWTELIFEGTATPNNIAILALLYSIPTWSGMAVFGKETWLEKGEAFSVFFGIIARFAPTEIRTTDPEICRRCGADCRESRGECVDCHECFAKASPEDREFNLRPWAVGLGTAGGASLSQLIFVVFVLSGVTYDSLLPTPLWVNLQGIVSMPETLGLVAVPLSFLFVYLGFVKLSQLFGGHGSFGRLAQTYVYSLVPIAVAYQVAHYLTFLFIQGQALIPLLSDPFGWGWDLWGTSGYVVNAALFDAAYVWYLQVALIVGGHLIAVYLSHLASLRFLRDPRLATRAQLPMLTLMVLYTVFSLWVLSQPIVTPETDEQARPALTVEIRDAEGNRVGTAALSEDSAGVQIVVELRKGQRAILPGEHGIHIHEKGEVAPGFREVGSHLNPTSARHGFEDPQGPHAGDLGNLAVLSDGSARYSTVNDRVTLSGGENSLFDADGSALIISEKPDDYATDPDGDSGDGVAGGVIEKSGVISSLGAGLSVLIFFLCAMSALPWGLLIFSISRRR